MNRTKTRILGLAFAVVLLGAGVLAQHPGPARAYQETGYTLPFYARWRIECDYQQTCLGKTHQGIDYSLGDDPGFPTYGEVIASAAAGRALACAEDFLAGWAVLIDHGGNNRTRYLHLDDPGPLIPAGTQRDVARGEILGYEGATGAATGPHLHFETRQGASSFRCDQQTSGNPADPHSLWQDNQPSGAHADFSPAIAAWGTVGSRVDEFIRSSSNTLRYRMYDGFNWSGWSSVTGATCLRSAPAATSWSLTRVDVFYRGCNDRIYHHWKEGSGSWNGEDLGGCTKSAPAAAAS